MGMFDWLQRLFGGTAETADTKQRESAPDTTDASLPGAGSVDEQRRDGNGEPPTASATALVEQATEAGYDLDFSPESLRTLDSLAENLTEEGIDTLTQPIVAYLGEVFVRNYEGTWTYVDDAGWLVDFSAGTPRDEANLFALPHATHAALEGAETFASVHDQAVAELAVDAPTLSDDAGSSRTGPPGDPLDDAAHQEYRAKASELVDAWPQYDLDYTPASLAHVDDLIATHYDMTPDDADREDRLTAGPPGVVPEGAELTLGTGGATTQLAAYIGEVFIRTSGATWYDGTFDSLVIETPSQTFELEPEQMVNAAYHGWVSFERLHDALATEHNLTGTE